MFLIGALVAVLLAIVFAPVGNSPLKPQAIADLAPLYAEYRTPPNYEVSDPSWNLAGTYHEGVCPLGSSGVLALYTASGDFGGDPQISVVTCRTSGVPLAWSTYLFGSAEDAATPTDLIEASGVDPIPLWPAPTLEADESEITCLWGDWDGCRLAIYRARYGPFLVTLEFVGVGTGYLVDAESFVTMTVDLDRRIANLLAS